ncbi:hypothetical protein I5Q83_30325 [Enterocloster clostridioformis]|nr:hypothetical protein I5Q83_30325 [Enterocloster clostridioformis]
MLFSSLSHTQFPQHSRQIDEMGKKFVQVKGVRWYTNIEVKQRHVLLSLRGNHYRLTRSMTITEYDYYFVRRV